MIGLNTGHRTYNYGTRLQAYALTEIMNERGLNNEIIYHIKCNKNSIVTKILEIMLIRCKLTKKFFNIVMRERELNRYIKKCSKKDKNVLKKKIRARFKEFDKFNKNNFKIKEYCCKYSDLGEKTKEYSAIFCGSDQAWLPANIKNNLYTLEYCDKNVKRISYAPSFGVSSLPEDMKEKYARFLSKFDNISVRESQGKDIVKELIGKDVPVVLDPTLMISDEKWASKATKPKYNLPKEYIFCYFLGDNENHRRIVEKIKKQSNLPVLSISHMKKYIKSDEEMSDLDLYEVSPFDFIYLVKNSKYVCTDSFHATVFSILFKKKFLVFQRFNNDSLQSTNSRLYSLLKLIGIENRIIADYSNDPVEILKESIDYNEVNQKLIKLREISNSYLDDALKGIE